MLRNVGGEKVVNAALDNGQADVHVHLAKGIYLVRFMKVEKFLAQPNCCVTSNVYV
ncbi:MAG: hypothetical protein ACLRTD_10420 [Bacteroides sp.]